MSRAIVSVFVLAVAATSLCAQTTQAVDLHRNGDVLLFVGDSNNEPFSYIDRQGESAGFDVQVIRALANKLNLEIEVYLLPRDQMFEAVRTGRADGIIGLGAHVNDDQLRRQWQFCGPTVNMDYGIVVRQDNRSVTDFSTLNGMRIAVLERDRFMAQMLFANNPGVTLVYADDLNGACLWVEMNRAAALVANRNAVRYYVSQRPDLYSLKFTGGTQFSEADYGPAIPAFADPALATQLRSAVRQLREDGTLAALHKQYFSHELYVLPMLQRPAVLGTLLAAAAFALLIAVTLFWRHSASILIERRTRKLTAELEVLRRHLADLQNRDDDAPRHHARQHTEPVVNHAAADMAPRDINEVIRLMEDDIRAAAGDIKVLFQYAPDLPLVQANEDQIRRALLNLCANARDAIVARQAAGPAVPHRIWVAARLAKPEDMPPAHKNSTRPFVAIAVRDTGCGLPADQVQKVFEAGFTTKPDAPGQGLTEVYGVVAHHGGWIDVESAPNRGATFSFFIPAAEH